MGVHGQGTVQLAAPQHLDQERLPDEAPLAKGFRGDLGARLEDGAQTLDVHHGEVRARRVAEPLELGNPALQGHLAPFEPELGVVARAPALGAPPGGLALPRRPAPADAAPGPFRALRRLQVMELHSATSSTRTRCETLRIMPRISGRSSLTTESRIRC